MGVEVDKVAEFSIDDPLQQAVAILELNPKDGMRTLPIIRQESEMCTTTASPLWK